MPKIALCFIISYSHILHKERFWKKWIQPNQDIINIYVHYSDIHKITSPWLKSYTIPPACIQQTSYYQVVPAYMAVLSYAYAHDMDNAWFCMATDTCVPIISQQQFREMFLKHAHQSIMRWKPAYWDLDFHRRANLRYLTKQYWLANDPWFIFTRTHVQQCLLFLTAKHGIYKKINAGGLANESIFAIIMETFHQLTNSNTVINQSSTICDWTRMSNPTSPYCFKEASPENIQCIHSLLHTHPYAMFLRKVHHSFPDDAIQNIIDTREPITAITTPKPKTIHWYMMALALLLLWFGGLGFA